LTPTRPRRGQQRLAEARRRRHERLVEQSLAIRRLHAAGADVADIARRVGVSRRTVERSRDLPEPPEPKRPRRPRRRRVLAPYEPYVLRRWGEGCHNGLRLYREIRERGYAHGASNVMRFVAQLRRDEAVRAGLTERWSDGPTEGFVHKLKLVKRQAYGRAGFAVLRQRLVRAA
jgi:transposase